MWWQPMQSPHCRQCAGPAPKCFGGCGSLEWTSVNTSAACNTNIDTHVWRQCHSHSSTHMCGGSAHVQLLCWQCHSRLAAIDTTATACNTDTCGGSRSTLHTAVGEQGLRRTAVTAAALSTRRPLTPSPPPAAPTHVAAADALSTLPSVSRACVEVLWQLRHPRLAVH